MIPWSHFDKIPNSKPSLQSGGHILKPQMSLFDYSATLVTFWRSHFDNSRRPTHGHILTPPSQNVTMGRHPNPNPNPNPFGHILTLLGLDIK